MIPKEVFHASSTQGLELILPHSSTHRKHWVYAMSLAGLVSPGKGQLVSPGQIRGQVFESAV
jgi:hypothetical protein